MASVFTRDGNGRIVTLESFFTLFPGLENSYRMLFGGKVLEIVDEVSGSLATLFVGTPGHQAVHVGEEVLFLQPILAGEAGKVAARVVLGTEKIVCVHVVVSGGDLQRPETFTTRYEGFGICAILDPRGAMVRTLEPYDDGTDIARIARTVIEFQRSLRKQLQEMDARQRVDTRS
ncbi:hypothetical protein HY480_03700 [Candidatus Uhrbacteria bacterium]|nr:hypothetical protein [Candidatus Uhrbacteria bacterium]